MYIYYNIYQKNNTLEDYKYYEDNRRMCYSKRFNKVNI